MKLLVVSQYHWPETFRINEVIESLEKLGVEVTVLTGHPNYPQGTTYEGYRAHRLQTRQENGRTVHRVPMVPRGQKSAMGLVLNYLSFVVSASVLGPWLLRGKRFDAILVYAPSPILQVIPGIVLKALKRAPLATWVQDLWPESLAVTGFVKNRKVLDVVRHVVRWIYRRNDLLLVQSEAFIAPVEALAGKTPVVYHPNPGEAAFSRPSSGPAPLRLDPGFNIVFAGNLGTVQALETVLDAAELTRDDPDIRWVLVGSGSRSDWLEQQRLSRGLAQVSMPGRFASEDMPGILSQASSLLVCLVRDDTMAQTVPSKVQAYLAAGRPIIAALDGEGARVVTAAGAGIASPSQDARALADAARWLKSRSPETLQAMGQAGRRFYEQHFDPDILAGRLQTRLRDLKPAS